MADLEAAWQGGTRSVLCVMPTGAGKTVLFCLEAARTPGRVLVVAHRRELILQAHRALRRGGLDASVWPSATPGRVSVGSVQTLSRRVLPRFNLIIVDECHHAVAGQYAALIEQHPEARILGMTASPERLDGRGLGTVFQRMVVGPSVADLVTDGWLVPCRAFGPEHAPDLSRVRTVAGEFNSADLATELDKPTITGDATAHYELICPYVPAIAFCVSVQHALHTAAAFRADGWRSTAVHGGMPEQERDAAIAGLANGRVQVLTSCSLIDEGLDVPGVGCVIDLAPTKSLGRYLQRGGRAMRPASGKQEMYYLDHAGNVGRHGLLADPRAWTLDSGRRKTTTARVVQCPMCYALHAPSPICPACSHAYAAARKPKREIEQTAGELQEYTADDMRLRSAPVKQLLKDAKTRIDVEAIAKARGYAPAWVNIVMGHRHSTMPNLHGREFNILD